MNRWRLHFAVPIDSPFVERPSPGAAPTAFRIWAAGENFADDGAIVFTRRSAELVMAEQEARGRLYASDFDHKSVLVEAGATDGRASGWHRLELRPDANGEPELWVVDLDWCTDAKAGLEAQPPLWRYFSPAFKDEKGEVVSYLNFALTINPATHGLPALASIVARAEGQRTMTKEHLQAAYAKICAAETTPEERAEAMNAIKSHLDSLPTEGEGVGNEAGEQPNPPHVEGAPPEPYGGEGTGGEPNKPPPAERTSSSGGPADPGNTWPSNKDKPANGAPAAATARAATSRTVTRTAAAAAVGHDLLAAHQRIDALEVEGLLAKHPNLPDSLRTWCATQTPATVKSFLSAQPRMASVRQPAPVQGDPNKPVGLQGAELEWVNKQMGIVTGTRPQFEYVPASEGGGLRIHTVRPSEARRLAALAAGPNGGAK